MRDVPVATKEDGGKDGLEARLAISPLITTVPGGRLPLLDSALLSLQLGISF